MPSNDLPGIVGANSPMPPTQDAGAKSRAIIGEAINPAAGTDQAKRGRGRPRKNPIAGAPMVASPGSPVASPSPQPLVDTATIEKSVAGCLEVADAYVARTIRRVAGKLKSEPAQVADLVDAAKLDDDERANIAGLAARVCVKRGILGQHADEILLTLAAGAYGARVFAVIYELRRLEKAADAKTVAPMAQQATPPPAPVEP